MSPKGRKAYSKILCYHKRMQHPQVRVGIAVFVIKNGKFLMLQRKGSHGEGTWSLPGGHLEYGESFEDTAKREVKEETNLNIMNVRLGGITNDIFNDENKHYVTIWMISEWESGAEQNMEPQKCTAQAWHTFDTLPEPLFLTWNQLLKSEFIETIKAQII
jgi:8-oxo-dGTP diphosphatase